MDPASYPSLAVPPNLDEMVVRGNAANDLLQSLFTVQQQPHIVYPLTFRRGEDLSPDGSGHRRLQHSGDDLHITIETHAPSLAAANFAQTALVNRLGAQVYAIQQAGRRRLQSNGDYLHHTTETHVCGLGSVAQAGCTAIGQTKQQARLVLSQAAIEAIVREPVDTTSTSENKPNTPHGRRTQSGGDQLHHTEETHAPTLDDMLVSGSDANARLAAVFIDAQAPLAIVPLAIATDGSHRRQLQKGGEYLHVTVETHAATEVDAARGVQRLASKLGGHLLPLADAPPELPVMLVPCTNVLTDAGCSGAIAAGMGTCEVEFGEAGVYAHQCDLACGFECHESGTAAHCDLGSRTDAVNAECCDEPEEDCSSGRPASCNAACAAVLLPFFRDCSQALGSVSSEFDDVVAMCREVGG